MSVCEKCVCVCICKVCVDVAVGLVLLYVMAVLTLIFSDIYGLHRVFCRFVM